jgi:hypothetical protein
MARGRKLIALSYSILQKNEQKLIICDKSSEPGELMQPKSSCLIFGTSFNLNHNLDRSSS